VENGGSHGTISSTQLDACDLSPPDL
jgi:hypothetical protein